MTPTDPPTEPLTLPAMVAALKARAYYRDRSAAILATHTYAELQQPHIRRALDLLERAHTAERTDDK